ncbi:MAG: hypothetical protein PHQ61_04810, partial [Candidatus Omnitrophica bacterium]|nr:hypothetical protein [Candidatus Omnitrophota bacterium]
HFIPFIIIVAAFGVSRILAYTHGLGFYFNSINVAMQVVDVELLKTDLVRSLFYLHDQPPLFNLFLGLVLKAFPAAYAAVFHACYLVMGLVLAFSVYGLMERMGVKHGLGTCLAVIFVISPSTLVYENTLFYTYPVAVMLALSALLLYFFVARGNTPYGAGFFLLLATVIYTRGTYHWVWFLGVTATVLLVSRKILSYKRVLYAAALPAALIAALCCKNMAIFGEPATCTGSWTWMSLMTSFRIPEEERKALVEEGKLSPLSYHFHPYGQVEAFYERFSDIVSDTGIPVLDMPRKHNGLVNYHNIIYVIVNDVYRDDVLFTLKCYPGYYLAAVKDSAERFFLPGPSNYYGEGFNEIMLDSLGWYAEIYDKFFLLRILPYTDKWTYLFGHPRYETRHALFWLLVYPMIMVYMLIAIVRKAVTAVPGDTAGTAVMAFMWITIMYTMTAVILVSSATNNRYRYPLEGFIFVFLGMFISDVARWIKALYRDMPARHGPGIANDKKGDA